MEKEKLFIQAHKYQLVIIKIHPKTDQFLDVLVGIKVILFGIGQVI